MPLRLVALGDSTVEGLMDPGPEGTFVGWADRFARYLAYRHPGLLYANLAVRGQTSGEVRRTQLDARFPCEPDVALLVAGVNDLLRPRIDRPALRDNLMTMYPPARRVRCPGADVHDAGHVTGGSAGIGAPAADRVPERGRTASLGGVRHDRGGLRAVPVAGHPALWHDDRLHANTEGHRRIAAALAEAFGLEAEDWRGEPAETAAAGLVRILGREAAWIASHLVPWVWGRVLRQEFATGGRCKRPELLPFSVPTSGQVDTTRNAAGD